MPNVNAATAMANGRAMLKVPTRSAAMPQRMREKKATALMIESWRKREERGRRRVEKVSFWDGEKRREGRETHRVLSESRAVTSDGLGERDDVEEGDEATTKSTRKEVSAREKP